MEITAEQLIAGTTSREGHRNFRATNPAASETFGPEFADATADEVDRALEAARSAFEDAPRPSFDQTAKFLEAIAAELLALGDPLIDLAAKETGLGRDRLTGERARTVGQLRMFAQVVRDGSWVDARIDTADPNRKPLPKPDVRRMRVPIGPVVVFGASNFPIAFSVAGGDTASALAGGNPVVFKAHPAHPNTSELIARAALRAADAQGMPPGTFSLIQGAGHEPGMLLVRHPSTQAVAFTGSLRGGRALFDAAVARPRPIPFFGEMGSVNPIFLLSGALTERSDAIARGLIQSTTLGVGQFCTNPGLAIGVEGTALERLTQAAANLVRQTVPGTMLYAGIRDAFLHSAERMVSIPGVRVEGHGPAGSISKTHATGILLSTDSKTFLANPLLHEECFGPSTLLVRCGDAAGMEAVARALEGQLTATIHGTPEDLKHHDGLVRILKRKAGRLLFNGFPTGVEVCSAMQHGGPYPATTDSHFTSVGSAAIERFVRPVSFQDFPASELPLELQDGNPRQIWRLVNDRFTKEKGGARPTISVLVSEAVAIVTQEGWWAEPTLRMRTILITGAAGFIGANLVRMLLQRDEPVKLVALDKLTYVGNLANLKEFLNDSRLLFVHGDICDAGLLQSLFSSHSIGEVVNLAAESHVDRSILQSAPFIQTNVVGTQILLDVGREAGVRKFLQVSTDEVYGSLPENDPTATFSENSPLSPNSPYSASKAAADCLVRAYHHTYGMPTLITRCSNNYGPYQFPEKIIPLFVTRLMQNQKVPLYGDGLNVRDWVYVEDHCDALWAVLNRGRPGEVYNIGGECELTNRALTETILTEMGTNWDSSVEYVADRPGHDRRYAIDFGKIHHELGWSPRRNFADAIRATIAWYRDHESWWKNAKRSTQGA